VATVARMASKITGNKNVATDKEEVEVQLQMWLGQSSKLEAEGLAGKVG
jgi:hypothetical protein